MSYAASAIVKGRFPSTGFLQKKLSRKNLVLREKVGHPGKKKEVCYTKENRGGHFLGPLGERKKREN